MQELNEMFRATTKINRIRSFKCKQKPIGQTTNQNNKENKKYIYTILKTAKMTKSQK